MASDATLTVCADPAALADTAANLIIDVATEAVRERGRFMLCLAGGETPRKTYERLALPAFSERVSWDRTWAFFGDERVVPPGHAESNYRMANETLLSRVPIPPAQILRRRRRRARARRRPRVLRPCRQARFRRSSAPQPPLYAMAVSPDFLAHITDQLSGFGPVAVRRLFGGADPAASHAHVPGAQRCGARDLPGRRR